MSIITSAYKPIPFVRGKHIETMVAGLLRRVNGNTYTRKRLSTPDGDFLDIDWYPADSTTAVIISHGLEGSSTREYMIGMAKRMNKAGLAAFCWNYRGCSGTINIQLKMYHSGATDDLDTVIQHVLSKGYREVVLLGFSLGGNLILKYIGEHGTSINPKIVGGVAFSVPLDLAASSKRISEWDNRLYEWRFLKMLKTKIKLKHDQFPDDIDLSRLSDCDTVWKFDDMFTGPLHGYKNASDYYDQCSSINFIDNIQLPCLIVNAKNDPFLPEECYPYALIKEHRFIKFETPDHGGHVGFLTLANNGYYWSEDRAAAFIKEILVSTSQNSII